MTPEAKVKKVIKKVLDDLGCYYFMPVQTGMGMRTLDFLVCYKGFFFGIEAKAMDGKPTMLQDLCRRKIAEAGGWSIVVYGVDDASVLRGWMEIQVRDAIGEILITHEGKERNPHGQEN